jgi:hypothetical protein
MIYQIKLKGELDQSWSDWLGEVEITSEQAEDGSVITTILVNAADQPHPRSQLCLASGDQGLGTTDATKPIQPDCHGHRSATRN